MNWKFLQFWLFSSIYLERAEKKYLINEIPKKIYTSVQGSRVFYQKKFYNNRKVDILDNSVKIHDFYGKNMNFMEFSIYFYKW